MAATTRMVNQQARRNKLTEPPLLRRMYRALTRDPGTATAKPTISQTSPNVVGRVATLLQTTTWNCRSRGQPIGVGVLPRLRPVVRFVVTLGSAVVDFRPNGLTDDFQ